ncbi:MAG: TraB/GumN family protein [Prevotellaceae bacterium]|jgi:uncharacterized protein YbaP (TraB family)|nr:TraB/GumN family protein [Prevotellaceae bacterium]
MKRLVFLFKGTVVFILSLSCFNQGSGQDKFKTSAKPSLLWEIKGDKLSKPSYLFGTIHFYDTSSFKIPETVYRALELCDGFAPEVDLNALNPLEIQQRTVVASPDSTLDKLVAPEIYGEIMNIPIVKMMGNMVKNMKPFFIQPLLMIENPFSVQSVDIDLNKYASERGKQVFALETLAEQFDVVDKISLREQARSLADIYDYCKRENMGFHEAGRKIFSALSDAYKSQDFDMIRRMDKEFKMTSSSPLFDSVFLEIRNINMSDRISAFIDSDKTLFAAVGMAHLEDLGKAKGIVTLLKEKGYALRPILIEMKK